MKKQKNNVEKQKQWLRDWYAIRLPLLGKEHLQQYVDKGLNTKYIGEKDLTRKEKKDFLASGISGMYLRGNRSLMKKVNKTDPTLTDIIVVSEQEPVIKSVYDSTTTPLHEYAHAVSIGYRNDSNNTNKGKISSTDMFEQFIPDFINNDKTKTGSSRYLSNDTEKYARIQELRYINDLDPAKTDYTIEDLNDFKKLRESQELIDELKRGGMNEQDIVNALNTWASNSVKSDIPFQINDRTYYAHFGGILNYFDYFK